MRKKEAALPTEFYVWDKYNYGTILQTFLGKFMCIDENDLTSQLVDVGLDPDHCLWLPNDSHIQVENNYSLWSNKKEPN